MAHPRTILLVAVLCSLVSSEEVLSLNAGHTGDDETTMAKPMEADTSVHVKEAKRADIINKGDEKGGSDSEDGVGLDAKKGSKGKDDTGSSSQDGTKKPKEDIMSTKPELINDPKKAKADSSSSSSSSSGSEDETPAGKSSKPSNPPKTDGSASGSGSGEMPAKRSASDTDKAKTEKAKADTDDSGSGSTGSGSDSKEDPAKAKKMPLKEKGDEGSASGSGSGSAGSGSGSDEEAKPTKKPTPKEDSSEEASTKADASVKAKEDASGSGVDADVHPPTVKPAMNATNGTAMNTTNTTSAPLESGPTTAEKEAMEAERDGTKKTVEVNHEATIPFSVEAINRGTLIALKLVDMDTVKYVLCSIASPNNGRDPDHEDDWELSCEGLSNRFASADFMRIVPKKGLEIEVDGERYTVSSFDASKEPFEVQADDKTFPLSQVTAAGIEFSFEVGDHVDVRDKPEKDWKRGIVKVLEPKVKVLVNGWNKTHHFKYLRVHKSAPKAPHASDTMPVSFSEGDRVEVRSEPQSEWRAGRVTSLNPTQVRVDGWAKSHEWNFIRKTEKTEVEKEVSAEKTSPELSSPEPTPAPKKESNDVLAAWGDICLKATCTNAGRIDDTTCTTEQVCGSTSGCTWDEAENPPCRKKLKLGDTVGLRAGSHEQGSIRSAAEVGVIVQVIEEDEQPFEVRGGYSDTYRYREDEVIPAWGHSVQWAEKELLNTVLHFWKGAPSFGAAAEALVGADVESGFKTPPPVDWTQQQDKNDGQRTAPVAPQVAPVVEQPPPVAPVTQPAAPPVGTTPTAMPAVAPMVAPPTPPAPLATPLPAGSPPIPPAPPVPVPSPTAPPVPVPPPTPAATAKAIGSANLAPTFAPKAPGSAPGKKSVVKITMAPKVTVPKSIVVYIPDVPALCGTYNEVKKKERGMPQWVAEDCETGECILFMSHGGFWMLGREVDDGPGNRGQCKSVTKATRQPRSKITYPQVMGAWHCHIMANWVDAAQGMVDLPEAVEKKGLDPKQCKKPEEEMKMGEDGEMMMSMEKPDEAAEEEKRQDSDGAYYSKAQFFEYYKSDEKWDSKASTSSLKVKFADGASVVATIDVPDTSVKAGAEGKVQAKDSPGKWKVLFDGDVTAVVDYATIKAA